MQGKTIYGYTIQRSLGTGGMAEVWLAENKLGKKAAVKLILPKLCDDEGVKSRFYTEAKVMVKLEHPNIRQVYDFGELEGRPVIVMEYLEGDDLKSRMKRGQRFTEKELSHWWNQLVSALNYTHQQGIVHRDIKPGNIFVNKEGNIKLLDFGIAKVRGSISDTLTGQQLGTLMYMSPEQVKDSKNIDYHTDLYSLAVTFVHLITGKRPYNSDTSSDFEIGEQIVYKSLDMTGVPTKWRDILTPYLAKEANQRPELKPIDEDEETEETIIEGTHPPKRPSPIPEPIETPRPPTTKPSTRGKNTGIIIGLVAIVVVLIGVLGWLSSHPKVDTNRLVKIYNKNLNELNFSLSNIDMDKEGHVGSVYFAIHSLQKLQEIEDMENQNSFKKLNLAPSFSNKFVEFKSQLNKADSLLSEEIQAYDGIDTEGDDLYQSYVDRRDAIRYLIRQSENKNSSLRIEIPKPQNK